MLATHVGFARGKRSLPSSARFPVEIAFSNFARVSSLALVSADTRRGCCAVARSPRAEEDINCARRQTRETNSKHRAGGRARVSAGAKTQIAARFRSLHKISTCSPRYPGPPLHKLSRVPTRGAQEIAAALPRRLRTTTSRRRCRSSLVFAATARAGRVTGGCRRDLVQGGTGPRRLPRTRGWASGRCPLCRTCNRESSRSGSTFHRSARAAGVSRLMARVLVRVWFRRIQGLLYGQHPRVRATLGFHQACRHPSGRAPGPLIVKRRVRVRPVRHLLMGRVGSQRPEPVVM